MDFDLDKAPVNEPDRQFYYIEKCRSLVSEFNNRFGRLPAFLVQVFGCQMSHKDGEKLEGILLSMGCRQAKDEDEADIILFTTCTVRENANKRLYGRIGRLKHQMKLKPELIIGISGCMMQEADEVEKIRKHYPYVRLIFGTHNIYKLAELLYETVMSEHRVTEILPDTDLIVEDLPSRRKYPFKASVNISFGCDNFCTYCIVPYVRGREKSRKKEDILRECKALISDGVKEITLLGQNVNSYGKDLEGAPSFPALLNDIAKLPGLRRLRFMTSNPKDLSDELITVIKEHKNIERHIHLPLQSGSDRILKRMNRHYTLEGYLKIVDKIRSSLSDISITTDLIVGFPGETEEDFQDTLYAVRNAEFDAAFTFIYSKREGTPAAKWDEVNPDIVKDRFSRLLQEVKLSSAKREGRNIGRILEVLIEEADKEKEGFLTGRLSDNSLVHFEGSESLIGQMVNVRIEKSMGFYYFGSLA